MPSAPLPELTATDHARYEWQMWVPDFGPAGQQRLKGASVLVSRVGGVGGVAAMELAAAGVGRIVLAHAGVPRPSDFNRQLTLRQDRADALRVETAAERLRQLNPEIEVIAVAENLSPDNAARLVGQVDLVVDCAPLFTERLAMNREAVRLGRPLVECAMYELTGQVTTILPGRTACLACRHPEPPPHWKRQFPVFGAVAGTVGCLGAMEAIKVLAGVGEPLADRLLMLDLRSMTTRTVRLQRNPACPVCGGVAKA